MASKTLIHDDVIYWPNGEGYTECTTAYRKAVERHERDPNDYEFARLMEEGHMGERVRYDKPDALSALLGGSSVVNRGGDVWEVVNVPGSRITIKDPDAVLTGASNPEA